MSNIIDEFFNGSTESINNEPEKEDIVGIDLGTSNSCVGIWKDNNFHIITDENGNRTIPSIVAFTNKSKYVGTEAKNQTFLNPKNVFYEFKRLIGKKLTDETVLREKPFLSYDLCGDTKDNVRITTTRNSRSELISPEELSAMILMKLKDMAKNELKKEIKKAVIAVPAYFNDYQRQATKDAASIAGLECVRLISEPVASALGFGLNQCGTEERKIIVYDLGGGTLDISLVSIENGLFEVVASVGNTHLGGVDFDNVILNYCLTKFEHDTKTNIQDITALSLQKLKKACENAKKILSSSDVALINIPDFHNKTPFTYQLTLEKFNELCNELFLLCIKPLHDLFTNSIIQKEDIDEIILVGGMTRVPQIKKSVENFFKKKPNDTVNPDEAVAIGASIQGYIIGHHMDPFSKNITLLDATTLSLGVEVKGGIMDTIIPRDTLIPCSITKLYSNDTDDATSISIKIYEGERKMTKDNFFVGEFELKDLAPRMRGFHKIEIKFTIDINGLITVSAKDLKGNNTSCIHIEHNNNHLTSDEINKIIETAYKMELVDKEQKVKRLKYNELWNICENITRNIADDNLKMSDEEKSSISKEILTIKEWLENTEFMDITIEEYDRHIQILNKEHIILVGQSFDKDNKVNAVEHECGTYVFQSDETPITDNKEIIKSEFDDNNTNNVQEIQSLRDEIINLCHDVSNILNNPDMVIDAESKRDMIDYVDDLLIHVYVQQKFDEQTLRNIIEEINDKCNKLVSDGLVKIITKN